MAEPPSRPTVPRLPQGSGQSAVERSLARGSGQPGRRVGILSLPVAAQVGSGSSWQNSYVELHAHSCWSLREGASSSDELVDRAITLGYKAMAVTDHDNLYGAMEYAKAAHERGLRPITGCELTVGAYDGEFPERSHLTVLAETVEGYRNLCQL